jgi:hypothetical protein
MAAARQVSNLAMTSTSKFAMVVSNSEQFPKSKILDDGHDEFKVFINIEF